MDIDKILEILYSHWSFLAVSILLGLIGEVVKTLVLPKDELKYNKFHTFFAKTMPLHPVLAGALIGLFLTTLLPDFIMTGGLIASVLYFACAGAASTWAYDSAKKLMPKATETAQGAIRNSLAPISDHFKK